MISSDLIRYGIYTGLLLFLSRGIFKLDALAKLIAPIVAVLFVLQFGVAYVIGRYVALVPLKFTWFPVLITMIFYVSLGVVLAKRFRLPLWKSTYSATFLKVAYGYLFLAFVGYLIWWFEIKSVVLPQLTDLMIHGLDLVMIAISVYLVVNVLKLKVRE